MKYTKHKPPHDKCEHQITYDYCALSLLCGRPAKDERFFDNHKAKPMRLCGIHANQARRAGYTVKNIGEKHDS